MDATQVAVGVAQPLYALSSLADGGPPDYLWLISVAAVPLGLLLLCELCGVRFIPSSRVGVVEKRWSSRGPVREGHLIPLDGEAGIQADTLRGGLHFGWWRWQYRIHKVPLVTVPHGKIAYVYARDGERLQAGQTLGRVVSCRDFQDARAFLGRKSSDTPLSPGQRGRQRAILHEGVYAINLALFAVLTEECIYQLNLQGHAELEKLVHWQHDLSGIAGFAPVHIAAGWLGIVTIHDGPSLPPGQMLAPEVGTQRHDADDHDDFQDIETFLRTGGLRGRQRDILSGGTYRLNRWFATVVLIPEAGSPVIGKGTSARRQTMATPPRAVR